MPGLEQSQLYGGRDLAVTTDFRLVLGEVVSRYLGNKDHRAWNKPGGRAWLAPIVLATDVAFRLSIWIFSGEVEPEKDRCFPEQPRLPPQQANWSGLRRMFEYLLEPVLLACKYNLATLVNVLSRKLPLSKRFGRFAIGTPDFCMAVGG